MDSGQNIDLRRVVASAIDWWRIAGVDALVDDSPRHWLAPNTAEAATTLPPAEARTPPIVAPTPIVALPDTLAAFEGWRLGPDAPDADWNPIRISASGSADGGLMILTDLPDREDEAAAMLLAGAAGRLFERMLAAIGRDRASVYLAPIATARPAGGRWPADSEAALGRIARHHVGLVRPRAVLALGAATGRAMLGANAATARGSLHFVNHVGGNIPLVLSFHPRFLLERPAAKAEAWKDLQVLIKAMSA